MTRADAPPRVADVHRRRAALHRALWLGAIVAALAIVDPDHPLPFDVCGFKWLTGWPCPTCGLTRAVCHFLRGHWATSVGYHPAGWLAAVLLIGAVAAPMVPAARTLAPRVVRAGVLTGITISVINWIRIVVTQTRL